MKNKKFEVKNLLGNSQKRTYRREVVRYFVGGVAWCLFLITFLVMILIRSNEKTSPEVLKSTVEVKAVELTTNKIRCDYDPITYLRCKGQQLGIKDTEITKIIATMKCESGLKADSINKNSNGTFDIGVGQINDVHSKRISREDRMDFVKNIDFIYTLYQEQGLNPWVCARKLGFTK